jgi:hypothetical protein
MSDEANEKQKHGQTQSHKSWQGYAALLFGIGVCLLLFICLISTADFDRRNRLIVYPLLLLSHSPSLSLVFGLSILILFMGAMMFAVWRGVMWLVVIFAFLIGVGLLGGAFIVRVFASDLAPQQTLLHQGHVYHLVVVWDGGGMDSPTKSYTVFQCDDAGWLCGGYATPYSHEYQLFDNKVDTRFEKFYATDALFIDEADQILKLRVGDEVYPVSATAQVREG